MKESVKNVTGSSDLSVDVQFCHFLLAATDCDQNTADRKAERGPRQCSGKRCAPGGGSRGSSTSHVHQVPSFFPVSQHS